MRVAIALLTASLLFGCGQKGSLYLPDSKREAVSTAAPAASAAPAPASTPAAADVETASDEQAARGTRPN